MIPRSDQKIAAQAPCFSPVDKRRTPLLYTSFCSNIFIEIWLKSIVSIPLVSFAPAAVRSGMEQRPVSAGIDFSILLDRDHNIAKNIWNEGLA